jgi:hypothetical protein
MSNTVCKYVKECLYIESYIVEGCYIHPKLIFTQEVNTMSKEQIIDELTRLTNKVIKTQADKERIETLRLWLRTKEKLEVAYVRW